MLTTHRTLGSDQKFKVVLRYLVTLAWNALDFASKKKKVTEEMDLWIRTFADFAEGLSLAPSNPATVSQLPVTPVPRNRTLVHLL